MVFELYICRYETQFPSVGTNKGLYCLLYCTRYVSLPGCWNHQLSSCRYSGLCNYVRSVPVWTSIKTLGRLLRVRWCQVHVSFNVNQKRKQQQKKKASFFLAGSYNWALSQLAVIKMTNYPIAWMISHAKLFHWRQLIHFLFIFFFVVILIT